MTDQCPNCAGSLLTEVMEKTVLPYGTPPVVYLCMELPMQRCEQCSLLFSGEAAEKVQEETIDRYRAVLCPPSAHSKSQLRRLDALGAKSFTCEFCGSVREIDTVVGIKERSS